MMSTGAMIPPGCGRHHRERPRRDKGRLRDRSGSSPIPRERAAGHHDPMDEHGPAPESSPRGGAPPSQTPTPPSAVETPPAPPPPPPPTPPSFCLVRARRHRKLAGVCGGLATAAGVDPTLVRVAVGLSFLAGWPILAYLFAWLVIPEEDPAAGRPLVPA